MLPRGGGGGGGERVKYLDRQTDRETRQRRLRVATGGGTNF